MEFWACSDLFTRPCLPCFDFLLWNFQPFIMVCLMALHCSSSSVEGLLGGFEVSMLCWGPFLCSFSQTTCVVSLFGLVYAWFLSILLPSLFYVLVGVCWVLLWCLLTVRRFFEGHSSVVLGASVFLGAPQLYFVVCAPPLLHLERIALCGQIYGYWIVLLCALCSSAVIFFLFPSVVIWYCGLVTSYHVGCEWVIFLSGR